MSDDAPAPAADGTAVTWLERLLTEVDAAASAAESDGYDEDAGRIVSLAAAARDWMAGPDARLIAAAPTMRAALQVLLDATKSVDPEDGAAKAMAMLRAVGIELRE